MKPHIYRLRGGEFLVEHEHARSKNPTSDTYAQTMASLAISGRQTSAI